jgi:hypothetical protein
MPEGSQLFWLTSLRQPPYMECQRVDNLSLCTAANFTNDYVDIDVLTTNLSMWCKYMRRKVQRAVDANMEAQTAQVWPVWNARVIWSLITAPDDMPGSIKTSEGGVKLFSRLRLQDMCNTASCYHTDYRSCRGQPQMCISLPAGVKCQWSTIGWEATSSDAFPDPCNGVRNLH